MYFWLCVGSVWGLRNNSIWLMWSSRFGGRAEQPSFLPIRITLDVVTFHIPDDFESLLEGSNRPRCHRFSDSRGLYVSFTTMRAVSQNRVHSHEHRNILLVKSRDPWPGDRIFRPGTISAISSEGDNAVERIKKFVPSRGGFMPGPNVLLFRQQVGEGETWPQHGRERLLRTNYGKGPSSISTTPFAHPGLHISIGPSRGHFRTHQISPQLMGQASCIAQHNTGANVMVGQLSRQCIS